MRSGKGIAEGKGSKAVDCAILVMSVDSNVVVANVCCCGLANEDSRSLVISNAYSTLLYCIRLTANGLIRMRVLTEASDGAFTYLRKNSTTT